MKKLSLMLCLSLWLSTTIIAQINFTALDQVPPYAESYGYGTNMGIYAGWTDTELADIAAGNPQDNIPGIGCNALRPALPESFLEFWGYDIRVNEFQHYIDIGTRDNVAIIGFPSPQHQDPNYYCAQHQSLLFDNMYLPIWDNGENGTPVNDDNYYALYLYRMVSLYKDYVKFWEVWNEPDLDYSNNAYKAPGEPGNWWENVPAPCDYKLRAPVFHYIRLLRISYEVIKSIDPDAYIALGGIGFPSFLDIILRHTDEPEVGAIAADYPLRGGAYFDVVSYHFYPHFDGSLREWSNEVGGFVYFRHSDAAAASLSEHKARYQSVLDDYGFDGQTYPEKQWIVTETNLPSESYFVEYLGSEEAQRNFLMKVSIQAQRDGVLQIHPYKLAEDLPAGQATYEFQRMGFFEDIAGLEPSEAVMMPGAIGHKTMVEQIGAATYHPAQSAALQLPEEVDGAAFQNLDGAFTYVLWAKTMTDNSETASATYSFPSSFNIANLEAFAWDHAQTGNSSTIDANDIQLNGAPLFLTPNIISGAPPTAAFSSSNTTICPEETVFFFDASENADGWNWSFPGGTPASSTLQNPVVVYTLPGNYPVTLEVVNANGSNTTSSNNHVSVQDFAAPAFTFSTDNLNVSFNNTSQNATSYFWQFGDGMTSSEESPNHTYAEASTYTITLEATNACGTFSFTQTVTVNSPIQPVAAFSANNTTVCPNGSIIFQDASFNANSWSWSFPGGTPSSSTLQNPAIIYTTPGIYPVSLTVSNANGSDAVTMDAYIEVLSLPVADFAYSIEDLTITLTNLSQNADTYLWYFGDGTTSTAFAPEHTYATPGNYTILLQATNVCGTINHLEEVVFVMGPIASYDFNTDNKCAPYFVQFFDNSLFDPVSWSWSFPGGNPESSTEENPIVSYPTDGFYAVELTVTNAFGNSDMIEGTLELIELDLPITFIFEDICEGDPYYYQNDTLSETGIYTYEFQSSGGCDSTVQIELSVNDTIFQVINDTIQEGTTYTLGDSIYDTSGTYFQYGFTGSGCDLIVQLNLTVEPMIAVHEMVATYALQITPNPFRERLSVGFSLPQTKNVDITLFNIDGSKVAHLTQQRFSAGEHQLHFDAFESLPDGLYLCQITIDGERWIQRLVKHRK